MVSIYADSPNLHGFTSCSSGQILCGFCLDVIKIEDQSLIVLGGHCDGGWFGNKVRRAVACMLDLGSGGSELIATNSSGFCTESFSNIRVIQRRDPILNIMNLSRLWEECSSWSHQE